MKTRIELASVFKSIDNMDADAFVSYLTDDGVFRYGSHEAVSGKEAIREYVANFFNLVRGLRHNVLDTWEGDDSVVVQGEVTYQKLDGSEVTVPFVNVFRLVEDRIHDYLIHIDPAPLMS